MFNCTKCVASYHNQQQHFFVSFLLFFFFSKYNPLLIASKLNRKKHALKIFAIILLLNYKSMKLKFCKYCLAGLFGFSSAIYALLFSPCFCFFFVSHHVQSLIDLYGHCSINWWLIGFEKRWMSMECFNEYGLFIWNSQKRNKKQPRKKK